MGMYIFSKRFDFTLLLLILFLNVSGGFFPQFDISSTMEMRPDKKDVSHFSSSSQNLTLIDSDGEDSRSGARNGNTIAYSSTNNNDDKITVVSWVEGTSTFPQITLNSPTNSTTQRGNYLIDLNITCIHNIDKVLYEWNSQVDNSSLQLDAPYDIRLPVNQGTHKLYVFANSTLGDHSNAYYEFTTDNSITWYETSDQWINVSLVDGVNVNISRSDLKVHWYWNSSSSNDRTFSPYSALRVETWGYNDYPRYADTISSSFFESLSNSWLLVNLTWKQRGGHDTLVNEYLVFYRNLPYFFVYARQEYLTEPTSTTLSSAFKHGTQPQICIFLDGGDQIYTPSPFNESSIKMNEIMPITYQWIEEFQKFPWITIHDDADDAIVGVIVLNVYPPCYDVMGRGGGSYEAQISFMTAAEGGVSEMWYFPEDFYWFAEFIVYPTKDEISPYYDVIDNLAEDLYHNSFLNTNFDNSFASANGYFSGGKKRMSIVNRVGCIYDYAHDYWGLEQGIIFWNGTIPRHYWNNNTGENHMLVMSDKWINISSDSGSISGAARARKTSGGVPSRYGYHVETYMNRVFDYPAYEFDVSLKNTWETWNDTDKFELTYELKTRTSSNLTKAYISFRKGCVNVTKLNSTTWEIYNQTDWGIEPSITLIFLNNTVEYNGTHWNFYLLNNTIQQEYAPRTKWTVTLRLWLHYGHITNVSQITTLHSIQPSIIAPFHTHFFKDIDSLVTPAANFSFYSNATFIDAEYYKQSYCNNLIVYLYGKGIQTIHIYIPTHGQPDSVTMEGMFINFNYDRSTKILRFNISSFKTEIIEVVVSWKPPLASFTYSPQEPTTQDIVNFHDTSYELNGSIISWYWDYGDGHTSTHKDPTHIYSDKGYYMVTLTVTDDDGNSNSTTNTVRVFNLAPSANFTFSPSSPKVGIDIQFTDKSTDPEGKTLEYLWDFREGFNSTHKNPTHRFTSSGSKYVELTVKDDEDTEDSITKSITIVPNVPPIADFSYSPENQKINHDVHFTDESLDSDGYIVEWFWDFGDGITSTQENPIHQFKEGGKYSVRLTVTDDNGDSDELVKKIKIIQTYDLTLQVKDFLGLNIPNVNIALYTNGECCALGSTDEKGELFLTEIPEGNYEIRAKVMGITTSTTCSLTQSKTEQIQSTLSMNTIGITGAIIVVIVVLGIYITRRRKISLPAEEIKREEVVPEEDVSLKMKKIELERERITEMLNTFKEKYDKGEIDKETYLRLKKKYENELERLKENK